PDCNGVHSRKTTRKALYRKFILPFRERSEVEEPPRFVNVLCDLITQCVYGWELDFIPQTLEKKDLNFGIDTQLYGMKIQQVRLDGERICSEGRPVADIRDRLEAFLAYTAARDINAIFRNELFVAIQIDRRYSVLAAIAATAAGSREDCEGSPQKVTRSA